MPCVVSLHRSLENVLEEIDNLKSASMTLGIAEEAGMVEGN